MIEKGRLLGICALFAAFLIGTINSIATTGLSVLDNDPASYIIVVMLMLFAFIAFSLKERLRPVFGRRNLAIAALIFAAYLSLISYLRVALSFTFSSYRIDAMLFPLLLISMIVALFGYDGLKRLKPAIVYSIFASPVLLLPVISLNSAFANANASFIYNALRSFGVQVAKSGLVITANSAASITISTTCVSLGTFIALIMFLVPVAYLYNGKLTRKAIWMVSAFALMVFLNLVRMLTIALVWVNSGLGSAISTFHAFAGQLIFYAVIIVMLLIAYRFGLSLGHGKDSRKRTANAASLRGDYVLVASALAFGAIAFAFSIPYWNSLYASPAIFGYNATYTALDPYVLAALANSGDNATYLGSTNAGQLFLIGPPSNATYAVVNGALRPVAGSITTSFNSVSGLHSYVLKNGVTISGAVVGSENATFDVAYFSLPFNVSGSYASANIEIFKRVTGTSTGCSIGSQSSLGTIGYSESGFYNLIHGYYSGHDGMSLCYAYRIAGSQ